MSEPTTESTTEPTPPPARQRWRDRAYGLRALAAVAVASLIFGGGAGAAIHAAVGDDGGRDGRPGGGQLRQGFPEQGGGMPGQRPHGMPGQPPAPPTGQQPATPPQDDVAPDTGDGTSSSLTS